MLFEEVKIEFGRIVVTVTYFQKSFNQCFDSYSKYPKAKPQIPLPHFSTSKSFAFQFPLDRFTTNRIQIRDRPKCHGLHPADIYSTLNIHRSGTKLQVSTDASKAIDITISSEIGLE